jgi:hypothetical protein
VGGNMIEEAIREIQEWQQENKWDTDTKQKQINPENFIIFGLASLPVIIFLIFEIWGK